MLKEQQMIITHIPSEVSSCADVSETTDLGIIIDSKLRFDKHITSMVRKAHIRAALIKRCFKSRDHDLLFRAFAVFVHPLLEYCSSVWNPSYHCDVD